MVHPGYELLEEVASLILNEPTGFNDTSKQLTCCFMHEVE